MLKIIDKIKSWFHHEVDDILQPIHVAIRRVEAFGQKLEKKASAARVFHNWADKEVQKAYRIGDKLRDLVK